MQKTGFLIFVILLLASCSKKESNPLNPVWKKKFPGIWQEIINKPDDFNLLLVANKKPRAETLNQKPEVEFPVSPENIKSFTQNGKTYLRFPLDTEEQIFGFGLNFKTVQQRGRILRLHVDHYGGQDNGRTHAPVPFFVSTKGYGVLVNSARYIDVYVGTGVRVDSKNPPEPKDRNLDKTWSAQPYSDNLEMVIPGEGVEIILFAGENMLDVVQRFNLYCGSGVLPPKWGLGFWQRTPTLYNEADIQNEIEGFAKMNFPLDVVGLEPGWHSKSYPCTFEWDKTRYPNPNEFASNMKNQGIHLNLWMNPYISPEGVLYDKLLPYAGTHTVWNGIVPDYTIDQPRKIMQEHFKENQLDIGISGFKMDEVDGYDRWLWPDIAQFPSGKDGEQMRQTYGLQMMTLTDEIYRNKNERTYGLIRAANAGSVSYPYVIYNDYYKHRDFITALINSGFSGLLWTPEVRASGNAEEWLRRMQTTCFSPLAMINAWADGTKPWTFPEVYQQCQEVAYLRMKLLPYLYSAFADYYFNGTPPFRAMNLEEGFGYVAENVEKEFNATDNPYSEAVKKEIKDQYMMGKSILVAPLFADDEDRKVILPQGNWYDFYTGEYVGNGEIITINKDFEQIPLFVKDGGIIPMISQIRQTSEWNENTPLEIRVYGTASGEFILYDDDGTTFNYEKGDFTTKKLKAEKGKGTVEDIHSSENCNYGVMNWNFMTKK
ncbi:MAG: glycoside hydrolase family 31 protein [Draconibacterium sp.]